MRVSGLVLGVVMGSLLLGLAGPVQGEPMDPNGSGGPSRSATAPQAPDADDPRGGGEAAPTPGELMRRLEILSLELAELRLRGASTPVSGGASVSGSPATLTGGESAYGLAPSASKVYREDHGVSLGGYGEAVYQNFSDTREDDAPSGRVDQFDFLRQILYVGYKFDDRFLLNTEIEIEHASTGKGGEVSVEFAYVDWLADPRLNVRAGMVLVPMGLINEIHEPTTFLGANRPTVERSILPATWRENGFGVFGEAGPVAYRSYLINGMDASSFSASGIRGGRQKGARAKAESFAWVGRLEHTTTPGLNVGGSAYLGKAGQDLQPVTARGTEGGDALSVSLRMVEAHAEWKRSGLEARVLGAMSWIGNTDELNRALGLEGMAAVGKRQWGAYAQLGYDLLIHSNRDLALVPYLRYERLDTQDDVADGFSSNPATDQTVWTFGLAVRPIDQVVLKTDYQLISNEAETGVNQFNAALGYIF